MKIPPLKGVLLANIANLQDGEYPDEPDEVHLTADIQEANVLTSVSSSDPSKHKIVLDIDMPATLVPSSTEGHFHLLIDKEIEWSRYEELLNALASAGLITHAYAMHSKRKGFTAVRLPWIKKGKP